MANGEMWAAPDIVPSIVYMNVPRAVEWLERVFGFRERAEARLTWPGGGTTWVEVGDSLFNISTPDPTWQQAPDVDVRGLVMKVYVEDVDRHFSHARAEGALIISEPQDGFWGGRTYKVLDHEGHRWEVSERGRDLAAERWRLPHGVTRGASE